ncbi:MBL fold metallo-hydrolase [Maribellus comscasis]|uniref:MBL fold metallo-hydrolase n=1 Tax=Maribellus comscasis TaxID=2681766 RepID=A0A6I6JJD0_9BACT|nr:MBL fold metallo-hydrolase [Maribellus comscasis]QGY42371.1 MBL fold metallo-hydrolase [Maribellus comscasis]
MTTSAAVYPLKINFEIPVSKDIRLLRFVYLFILSGKKIHFIDTGVADGLPQVKTFLKKTGRKLSEVQNILLTHSHPDHIGAAKLIQQKSGCKIIAGKKEQSWIENTELQYKQRPVPGFHHLVAGSVKVDVPVKEGDIIKPEEHTTIRVLSTPGHSAGSVSFFLEEQKALFSGDAILLPGEIPIFDDIEAYFRSLDKIEAIQPKVIYSAWDEPRFQNEIPGLLKQSKNYISQIKNTVQKVARKNTDIQSMDFCKAVLKEMRLNEQIANPLLMKTFSACLK